MSGRIEKPRHFLRKRLVKAEDALIDFWHSSRQEIHQTREAEKMALKYVKGQTINEEERLAIKEQGVDILKIVFIGVPLVVIPGFSIVMILLVKIGRRFNFNVLPSAFTHKDTIPDKKR